MNTPDERVKSNRPNPCRRPGKAGLPRLSTHPRTPDPDPVSAQEIFEALQWQAERPFHEFTGESAQAVAVGLRHRRRSRQDAAPVQGAGAGSSGQAE